MGDSIYQIVTNRIIEQLKEGIIPWKKGWTGSAEGAYNTVTNKSYSLLNQMLLTHNGEYGTYKQWSAKGGKVKKGEKSEIVTFWKMQDIEIDDEGTTKNKKIPLLRYYNVFHVSQVEGVTPNTERKIEFLNIEQADKIIADYAEREDIEIKNVTGDKAFYSPVYDYIQLPQKTQFINSNEYYGTTFHEIVHSTGHSKRLDRLNTGVNANFGSQEYSKEELIAEIGSAIILNKIDIETKDTFKNNVAYIQSWINVLENDVKCIVSASSKADKAVKYIFVEE